MFQGSAAASSKRKTQFYRLYARNKVCRRGRGTENGKRDVIELYTVYFRKKIEGEHRARLLRIDTGGRTCRKVDLGMQYLRSTQPRSCPEISFMI